MRDGALDEGGVIVCIRIIIAAPCARSHQLDWAEGVITMAGVFGKDPNMKKNTHAELERLNAERKRKLAEAAAKFTTKKPVAGTESTAQK